MLRVFSSVIRSVPRVTALTALIPSHVSFNHVQAASFATAPKKPKTPEQRARAKQREELHREKEAEKRKAQKEKAAALRAQRKAREESQQEERRMKLEAKRTKDRERKERVKEEEREKRFKAQQREEARKNKLEEHDKEYARKLKENAAHFKDPERPKRARSPFLFFVAEKVPTYPKEMKITERAKQAAADWKALSEEQKKPYHEKAYADHERFEKETEAYNKSKLEAPKRPLSGFARFLRERMAVLRQADPELKVTQGTKRISEEWAKLSQAEKDKYTAAYKAELPVFEKARKEYITRLFAAKLPPQVSAMMLSNEANIPRNLKLLPGMVAQIQKEVEKAQARNQKVKASKA